MIALENYLNRNDNQIIKLHLGCGGVRWKDFINVDLHVFDSDITDSSRSGCVADAFADIRNLNLDDNLVDEIFLSHVFEHFTRWQGEDMLNNWFRILKPGGFLVIETPDFWRCVLWLFHPKREKRHLGKTQFYGNQWDRLDYETHRYLWSSGEIKMACKLAGFESTVLSHRTETHHPGRDMRVVAIKPPL